MLLPFKNSPMNVPSKVNFRPFLHVSNNGYYGDNYISKPNSGRLRHVCNEFVNSAHIKGNQNNAFHGF